MGDQGSNPDGHTRLPRPRLVEWNRGVNAKAQTLVQRLGLLGDRLERSSTELVSHTRMQCHCSAGKVRPAPFADAIQNPDQRRVSSCGVGKPADGAEPGNQIAPTTGLSKHQCKAAAICGHHTKRLQGEAYLAQDESSHA